MSIFDWSCCIKRRKLLLLSWRFWEKKNKNLRYTYTYTYRCTAVYSVCIVIIKKDYQFPRNHSLKVWLVLPLKEDLSIPSSSSSEVWFKAKSQRSLNVGVRLVVRSLPRSESRYKGNDQETIQSNSTTSCPKHQMGKGHVQLRRH